MTENQRPLIATPTRTRAILEKYRLGAKKSLGQNFITEPNILRKIVSTAAITAATNVIEVGPGIGALTELLAQSAREVLAFEIDERLLTVLSETLSPYHNIKIIHQDILKTDLAQAVKQFADPTLPLKVVANLPYYITTPIMMHFLESGVPVAEMVLMVQKEVADRLSASPGTKAYGSLSIAVQYYMETKTAFIVPRTVFMPQPNVDSAIIRLTRRTQPLIELQDEKGFFRLVRGAFHSRRKTLWNNLLMLYGKNDAVKERLTQALAKSEIDPKRRGETLSIEEFAKLSNCLAVTE